MAEVNTGQQGYKILTGIYLDDQSQTGYQKPNLQNNSPQALVPLSAVITYNYPTDVAPTGGNNNDIWYNPVADQLFKNINGTWTELNDRVSDPDYVQPVENTEACPVPTPPPTQNNFSLYAQYGLTIQSLTNGSATGIPAAFAGPLNLTPGNELSEPYSSVGAGTGILTFEGTPSPAGHVVAVLEINGSVVWQSAVIDSEESISIPFPATSNPATILVGFATTS